MKMIELMEAIENNITIFFIYFHKLTIYFNYIENAHLK